MEVYDIEVLTLPNMEQRLFVSVVANEIIFFYYTIYNYSASPIYESGLEYNPV